MDNFLIIPKAVWNKDASLLFDSNMGSRSKVEVEGGVRVEAIAIDDCVECKGASFIKMDIERAEFNALIGAKKTIKKILLNWQLASIIQMKI